MDLTLIGTAHHDPDCYKRLCKVFEVLEPEVLCIEDTIDEFNESLALGELLQDPEVQETAIRKLLVKFPEAKPETFRLILTSMQYEPRTITDYVKRSKALLVFCDNQKILDEAGFEDAAKDEKSALYSAFRKILCMSPSQLRAEVAKEYEMMRYPVKDCNSLVKFYSKRDVSTEAIIRRQNGRVVYICGLDHIFGDYHPNLFDRLLDLRPKRRRLSEFT